MELKLILMLTCLNFYHFQADPRLDGTYLHSYNRACYEIQQAIESFGRPKSIELLILINRRYSRELPIQASNEEWQILENYLINNGY